MTIENYIFNRNTNQPYGEHEIHRNDGTCPRMPDPENRVPLGHHSGCRAAMAYAKIAYPGRKFDGCFHCSKPCHTV